VTLNQIHQAHVPGSCIRRTSNSSAWFNDRDNKSLTNYDTPL